MALLCGIQCGNLYTFHVALSHVYKLYTQGKIMLQMSVLPWLTPTELLFQVLGAVSAPASVKCCPSHLGRYIVPISARKMFPVFVRLWVYAAETPTRCVRKSGGLEQKISVLVSHKIGWFVAQIHGQYCLVWMERLDASDFICESVLQNSYFIVTKTVLKS